ncbi:MAG: hypothetical protein IKQ43_12810 [Treponema sp.]|nr:hypothetical protein [Treponema sp.]MBR7080319.1 hypothetical protein [Treponema sp.]
MKLIKKITTVLACLGLSATVFAVDFGGSLDNYTKLSTSNFENWGISQQDGLTAWLKIPFNQQGSLYLATEGTLFYRYNLPDFSNTSKYTSDFMVDIGLFKLGGVFNIRDNLLQLNLGRFYLTDVTGLVLSQTADGAQGVFTSDTFKASVYVAYTGFTNALFGTMNNGPTSTFVPDYKKVYCFNSPYIVTGATISAPYLFANQTIGAEVYGMFGTGGLRGSNSGYNRGYATVFMNGPIVKNLFYTLTTTLAFNNGVSNLTIGTITYYPDFKSASISLNAIYASGETGGIKAFKAFSSNVATYARNQPEYTNMLKFGLRGSIKPIDSLYTSVGTDVVFDSGKDFGFRGVQWDASVKYQIFTDLQLAFVAKQFFDVKKDTNNNTSFSINASLAF